MSLFHTIKGTFKAVQDDVTEGLKSLTTVVDKPHPTLPVRHSISPAKLINYEAGGELMHKHEGVWKELYEYSEQTGKNAQDVDVAIAILNSYCEKHSTILTRLHKETAEIPCLLNQLQSITDTLASVEEECDKVEAILVQLQDVCDQQEFVTNQASHHKQLAVYRMKKEHELQSYKVRLARNHAHKMEAMKKKREHLLQERQAAFEEQFSQDVDYFKKHGQTGRLPSTPESQKKLDLADVELEEDSRALDAFFESSSNDTSVVGSKGSPDVGSPNVEIAEGSATPIEPDDNLVAIEDISSCDKTVHEPSDQPQPCQKDNSKPEDGEDTVRKPATDF